MHADDHPLGDPFGQGWPARFAAPGQPGFVSQADLQRGMPWSFAGLTAGAFAIRDPLLVDASAAPGWPESVLPVAWYDSTAMRFGEGAGWQGFGATLAEARGFVAPPGRKPRAVFTVTSGANALDRNGLFVERGDAADPGGAWFRGGATSEKHGAVGGLDRTSQHVWFLGAGTRRGAHAFSLQVAQSGIGQQLPSSTIDGDPAGGFGEGGRGIRGAGEWRWTHGDDALRVRLERGVDMRDSHGTALTFFARRDAWRDAADVAATRVRGAWTYEAHVNAERASVVRWGALSQAFGYEREAWESRAYWAAVRASGPFATGTLNLELGGGTHDAPARTEERRQLAPAAAWRLVRGTRSMRVFAERVVTPIWSDLSPGTRPFMQDVWSEGLEGALTRTSGARVSASVTALQANGRALLLRYPLRDIALRNGWRRADANLAMLLAQASAGGRWHAFEGDVSGWALSRPHTRDEARTDPAQGAVAGVGTRFRTFANDLGVHLRLEGAYVGTREADPLAGGFAGTLPSYVTISASGAFTLGDATLVLRGEQLEGTRHEEVWTDPIAPDLRPALGPGRSFRIEVLWPLFD